MSTTMEIPDMKVTGDSSPSMQERHLHHHHHHNHHHHEHLTKFSGKAEDATGKKVLVGVDGSDHSNYALDWYFEHIWSQDDYMVLLNCPDHHDVAKCQGSGETRGKYVFDRESLDQKLKEGEETIHHDLEKFKDKLIKQAAHGKVIAVSAKSPGDAILKTAEEEQCDLIVIGCRDRSTLRRTILGTVSDYIVHHSSVPVVVCRRKTTRRKSSAITPPNLDELNIAGK
ncbi:stress response protein nhax [Plakobranchus ocellatus]|uniref:Stress response protein nhax n=1 Tax=Plakobranchus ocellatus TaxID=259542 RepID=A0AAV4BJ71_9GAST|nr:stress response protein nhax [Plakobranchus ocellatus]